MGGLPLAHQALERLERRCGDLAVAVLGGADAELFVQPDGVDHVSLEVGPPLGGVPMRADMGIVGPGRAGREGRSEREKPNETQDPDDRPHA